MFPRPEDFNDSSSESKSEMLAVSYTRIEFYDWAWYCMRKYKLSLTQRLVLLALAHQGMRRSEKAIAAAARLSLPTVRRALKELIKINVLYSEYLRPDRNDPCTVYELKVDSQEMWSWWAANPADRTF
ncbi:MAG: MarR family transcriptional regulator [Acidobacteriota bacterium]|nr:MarR family transcriptional regulator [Acidobacteriota bacterium]